MTSQHEIFYSSRFISNEINNPLKELDVFWLWSIKLAQRAFANIRGICRNAHLGNPDRRRSQSHLIRRIANN